MENETLVLDVLKKADAPLKSAQIAEIAKMDKKDVDNAIKKLKQADKIISPKVCFYTIKK